MVRLPYGEGDWAAIPIGDGLYASALIARVGRRGACLGYFFGPARVSVPELSDLIALVPEQAVLVGVFGDLGLIQGTWLRIGPSPDWDRDLWKVPSFKRHEELVNRYVRVELDETSLVAGRETEVSREVVETLPQYGLMGSRSVESRLTHMLAAQAESESSPQ